MSPPARHSWRISVSDPAPSLRASVLKLDTVIHIQRPDDTPMTGRTIASFVRGGFSSRCLWKNNVSKMLINQVGAIRGINALGMDVPSEQLGHPVHRLIRLLRCAGPNGIVLRKLEEIYPNVPDTPPAGIQPEPIPEEEKLKAALAIKIFDGDQDQFDLNKAEDVTRSHCRRLVPIHDFAVQRAAHTHPNQSELAYLVSNRQSKSGAKLLADD
jgi:hypothetical protein